MPVALLSMIAVAVLLGVWGQILASATRMPAILFLLVLGMAAGPYGLSVIEPAQLGVGLQVIVSSFVAVILFEGALTLPPALIAQALVPVRRLISIGAAITLLLAAVLAHFVAELPWPLAFLFASLIVVTGPTVIAPILRRVPLVPRLHAILKSESILIDPVGVFVAVLTFETVVGLAANEATLAHALTGLAARVGIGLLIGAVSGFGAYALTRLALFHRPDNEHLVSLGALGLALSTFAAAERVQSESGIMAVIVAGLILATVPLPFRDELEKFKDQVTVLGVSVLFILLAANLNLPLLMQAGPREALLLAGLILLVRPVSVFVATIGTGLSWREKTYLSLLAPRGILAAAMASYFAGQLRERNMPGANRIEMLVFFTIAITVLLQGGWASWLARVLKVQPVKAEGVLLIGVNAWSLALAEKLRELGRSVLFVDRSAAHCETARERGFEVHEGDATESDTYLEINLSSIGVVVAMTPNDAVNTLACDAASTRLPRGAILQVISKPIKEAERSRVRIHGRWAMPSRQSHQEIIQMLASGQLAVETERCSSARKIGADFASSKGPMVPLLVLAGRRLRIAEEGADCPTEAIVVGLVRPMPRVDKELTPGI